MTDQDAARDRAVRELTRRLHAIVPASLLADPHAFARSYWDDATADGWYHRDLKPAIKPAEKNPDAYKRGAPKAREALTRKDQHDA